MTKWERLRRGKSAKLAYGPDNPYARDSEYATVAAVTRQDLLDWHHAHVAQQHYRRHLG